MTTVDPDATPRQGAGSTDSTSGAGVVSGFAADSEDRARVRSDRTWTVLVAALGGEGGGVLSSWLIPPGLRDPFSAPRTAAGGGGD